MNNQALEKIQSCIGYRFKDNRVLETAFTHSSYVNEHGGTSNERCEFLGDCVLNFLVGEHLYFCEPDWDEGKLSARRASVVSRGPLAQIIDSLGLIEHLRVGAGVNKSAFSEKVRSNLFEAILGAVYLDGGLDECRTLLDRLFFGKVKQSRDYKSELQKLVAAKGGENPIYPSKKEGDLFVATVTVNGNSYEGRGKTKSAAETMAACAALKSEFGR